MTRSSLYRNKTPGYQPTVEDVGRTTGNRFYVDSGAAAASDTAGYGRHPDQPFATIDFAIGQCTANNGDVIYVMPGHVEDLAASETIDADVAGISIIGLGNGPDRPRIDYNATSAEFDIGASGVLIENLTFRPSVALVVKAIDVETTRTNVTLRNIEFLPGEAGDGTDEFVDAITVAATCTRFELDGCVYAHHASADGAQTCISFTGVSDLCRVRNCWINITGTAAVAGVECTAACTRMLCENVIVITDAEPGFEMSTSTGVLKGCHVFSDLATIDAATVATNMAHIDCKYVEVGNEAGTLIKTESVDD